MRRAAALAWYRLLLHILPSEFREAYGCELTEAFEAIVERRGPTPWVVGRASVDVIVTSVSQRRQARERRATRSTPRLRDSLWYDVRLASRRLRRAPGAFGASVGILGLGIAATCTVFALVDSVLLEPLDYAHPERLVALFLHETTRGEERAPTSPSSFTSWRDQASSLELMTAAHPWQPVWAEDGRAQQLYGLKASPSLFELLGVSPLLGSTFHTALDRGDDDRVVVIGERLWRRELASDPDVIGRRLLLGDEPYTVIAVMPDSFAFPPFWATEAEMWAPLVLDEAEAARHSRYLRVFARMRPETRFEQVRGELAVIGASLVERFPDRNAGTAVRVERLLEPVVSDVRKTLWILLAAVVSVVLIAGVNAAGLAAVRALDSSRDTAVAAALGASPWRLMAPALLEGVIIASSAGVVGLAGGFAGLEIVKRFGPQDLPRLATAEMAPEAIAWTFGICAFAAIGVGLAPALRARRLHANRDVRRNLMEPGKAPLLSVQIAMSVLLLTCAGLLSRSYLELAHLSPGFSRAGIATMTLVLPTELRGEVERQRSLVELIEAEVESLPGVASAAFVNHLPIGGDLWGVTFAREDLPTPVAGSEPRASFRVITPDYFTTLQIPLVEGRLFNAADEARGARNVIVNEKLAGTYWPGSSPIGKRILSGGDEEPWTVIGIVGNVRQLDLASPIRPELYFNYATNPAPDYLMTSLAARTHLVPEDSFPDIRRAISRVNERVALTNLRTMDGILTESLWQQRFNSLLMTVFAIAAVILAATGLYGVISYTVSRRVREMAIRQAIGARPRDVASHIVVEGLRVTGWGIGVGVALSYVLADALESLLFGVSSTDPMTYAAATTLVAVVSLAASYVPARRAAKLDPVAGLRAE